MKHIILLTIFGLCMLGCATAGPHSTIGKHNNIVCEIISLSDKTSTCEDKTKPGGNIDVAFITKDGGLKVCWETFNEKALGCATLQLSKTEAAELAVQNERERAKHDLIEKTKQEAEASAQKTEPVAPTPTIKKPEIKK